MTPNLLKYICEPVTKAPLILVDAVSDSNGHIQSGSLVTSSGRQYPIINGIPRFVDNVNAKSVTSFGDEWNHFNFTDFKTNWLKHTVLNTFGTTDAFKDKLIVDAGGGSGAQSKWFSEYGARHVIMMDLSHSVDDVVSRNLLGLNNVDVIQCSIDEPPLLSHSIEGIVYCHNVIQHTPSVEKTAKALFELVAPGGEFVFNCYGLNDEGVLRWIRWHLIYLPLRAVLSRMPFLVILFYAKFMSLFRIIPIIGEALEKLLLCVQGDVPSVNGDTLLSRTRRRYMAACLNTFDAYGSHKYQHHMSDAQIMALVFDLQFDAKKVLNSEKYYAKPQKIGAALRVLR